MKKRTVPLWLVIPDAFLIVLFVFLTVWWFGFSYPYFHSIATEIAPIPGLSSGLCPQGICVLPKNDYGYDFAMSGYIDGAPSRVYLIDEDISDERYVTFTKDDGVDIDTHFGGVTATDDYLYIASDTEIIRIALADIFAAENGASMKITDSFDTGMGNAYCYYFDGNLYVGEFYRPKSFETDNSHHITINGKTNRALVYIYGMDESKTGGVATTSPHTVISVPDQVQGIAVTADKIYLSTSYGLPDSKLYIYENKLSGEPDTTISLAPEISSVRPLYFLEPKAADLTLPCMSEEICAKDGKLYVLFESMAKKYRYVVHYRISKFYAIDFADMPTP